MKKVLLIIGSIILGLLLLFLVIGILSDNGNESSKDNENKEEMSSKSKSKKDKKLDVDIDNIVSNVQIDQLETATNLYNDGTITKARLKDINTKIINQTDKEKESILKDENYDDIVKRKEDNNLSDRELREFLAPYLRRIQEVLQQNV